MHHPPTAHLVSWLLPGNGKINKKDPKNQLNVAIKKLDEVIEILGS